MWKKHGNRRENENYVNFELGGWEQVKCDCVEWKNMDIILIMTEK